jgi:hypothetical protein
MIKKLIELLEKEALSPNAFFLLTADVFQLDVNVESECSLMECLLHLQNHKYIKIVDYDKPEYKLRQKGIDFIKQVDKMFQEVQVEVKDKPGHALTKSDKVDVKSIASGINEWLEDYRNLFKGLKPGSKGDKGACLNKMVRFFQEYPEFADKDIIMKAASKYIQNEAHQNYRFLQRADYFIFKLNGKEETSRLASFCDELDEVENEGMTKML